MKAALRSAGVEPGRFLRREGNLKVRRERRQRNLARALTRISFLAGALGLTAATVAATARWLLTSPTLAVKRIQVEGTRHAGAAELQSLADRALHRNLVGLDLRAVAADLREHPWVQDVVIRKQLPDTLVVNVVERVPYAVGIHGGEVFLIGNQGEEIDHYGPRYAAWSFPVLRGLDGLDEAERSRRYRLAGSQMSRLADAAPELYARLNEVDLTDPGMAVLWIDGLPERLRVDPEDWTRNLDAFRALHAELRQRHGALRYVDLRWQGRLAVKQKNR